MRADWNPPTVADTKKRFYETFRKPIPGLYNNVIQELLVQQHIMRYNKKYRYDEVQPLATLSRMLVPCSCVLQAPLRLPWAPLHREFCSSALQCTGNCVLVRMAKHVSLRRCLPWDL